ncbi:hypothetical protein PCASD_17408 [Puccinia coronata f. sp. avenae]|uniref:Uncharacterized protein n=1 Tax=Puccinia coronata f. sp. avenae TaxID=200324 RepID=A0A2N5TX45_9BASI|nr:hypothetical protein PCASD_17408 [Puccinia coronata f. sp. avenae]
MRAIVALLILVAHLAIGCTAGMEWESCEDLHSFCDNWCGEDNQRLQALTLPSYLQALSHTSLTDAGPRLVGSMTDPIPTNTPVTLLEDAWDNLVDGGESSGEGSTGCNNEIPQNAQLNMPPSPSYHEADLHTLNTDAGPRYVGSMTDPIPSTTPVNSLGDVCNSLDGGKPSDEVTGRKDEIPQNSKLIMPPNCRIRMKEKESEVHQLRFDQDAFEILDNEDSDTRLELIKSTIIKHSAHSQFHPPTLTLPNMDAYNFVGTFNSNVHRSEAAGKPSEDAGEAIERYLASPSSSIWKAVYENRLGIDFEAIGKVFLATSEKHLTEKRAPAVADRFTQFFLVYLFFVDMLLTTIPKPTGVVIDRIRSFHTAVTCFDNLMQDSIQRCSTPQISPCTCPKTAGSTPHLAVVSP